MYFTVKLYLQLLLLHAYNEVLLEVNGLQH